MKLSLCVAASVALACGSPATQTGFGDAPIETITSDGALAQVAVWAAPSPLLRGNSTIKLVLTDPRTNAPLDDADVSIVPWMPAMGHGSSIVPTVTSEGDGVYVVSDLVLIMPGTWELRLQLGGALQDTVTVNVSVE